MKWLFCFPKTSKEEIEITDILWKTNLFSELHKVVSDVPFNWFSIHLKKKKTEEKIVTFTSLFYKLLPKATKKKCNKGLDNLMQKLKLMCFNFAWMNYAGAQITELNLSLFEIVQLGTLLLRKESWAHKLIIKRELFKKPNTSAIFKYEKKIYDLKVQPTKHILQMAGNRSACIIVLDG